MKKSTLLSSVMSSLVLLLNVTFVNAQTFNLQTVQPATIPAGLTLEWYNGKPFTASTMVANVTAVDTGVYYAVYKNASGCLSEPSAFKLVRTMCPTNTADLYASVDSTNKPSGTMVTFHTAKPVSGANIYGNAQMVPPGMYYVSYYDAVKDCYTLGSAIRVIPNNGCVVLNDINDDYNVTFVNVPVSGSISTNDHPVPGSTYSSPVAATGNPNTNLPVINLDGTYTFVTDLPGVYVFTVNVCGDGQTTNCPTQLLTITVLDPTNPVTPPVANPDFSTTKVNAAVVIPVKVNDDATSPNGALNNPNGLTVPSNGTASVNADGTITYTPNTGFTGIDSFRYSVCDTALNPALCAETYVVVRILPSALPNVTFAADDYNSTYGVKPVNGNVLTNDTDPEGNIQTVAAQTTTNSMGTLVLMSDGSYTYTPADGFIGTVNYPYNVCDNGTPQACTNATLHITVDKAPDYTVVIYGESLNYSNADTTNDYVVAIQNVNNTLNKGALQFKMLQQLPNKYYTVDPNATTMNVFGGVTVQNAQWDITTQGAFIVFTLKPGVIIPANGTSFVGIKIILKTASGLGPQNVTANITHQSGGDYNFSNNTNTIRIVKNENQ